jgi:hypothetical protein
MLKRKMIITIGVTSLFLALSLSSVSGNSIINKTRLFELEQNAMDKLFEEIESAAYTANNFEEFLEIVRNLYKNLDLETFPILRYILNRILYWATAIQGYGFGQNINKILDNFRIGGFRDSLKNNFIFSYGTYKRWNPRKEDELKLFKQGFEFWRYSGKPVLLNSRTIIIERQPFGIKQRVIGSQIGYVFGFRGIYIDRESKLTGNSYRMFIGGANRAKAYDITPFSP